jgi:hypothetical protein
MQTPAALNRDTLNDTPMSLMATTPQLRPAIKENELHVQILIPKDISDTH